MLLRCQNWTMPETSKFKFPLLSLFQSYAAEWIYKLHIIQKLKCQKQANLNFHYCHSFSLMQPNEFINCTSSKNWKLGKFKKFGESHFGLSWVKFSYSTYKHDVTTTDKDFVRKSPPKGSTLVKNEVRHGHFKSSTTNPWPFIKTVESDVKVL